jgi:hypothetical protein
MTVEGFGAAYARAKELQAHAWSDELAELADDDSLDPQVRRVKFDIKKWLMSKQCFERSRSTRITADRVVLELEKLAFSNIFDLIELRSDGSVDTRLLRATRDRTAAIHDVVVRRSAEGSGNEGGSVKLTRIQLRDKVKALDMLARHLGMFSMSERRSRRPKLSAR